MLEFIRRQSSGLAIKIIFGAIILVFIFFGVGSFRNQSQSVVAYVGDAPVGVDEYRKALQALQDQVRKQFPGMTLTEDMIKQLGIRRQALTQLAEGLLLRQKAQELGIAVADKEIQEAILKIPAFQDPSGKFEYERYQQLLKANGYTEARFEAGLREDLLRQRLLAYLTMGVHATEAEAKDLFMHERATATIRYIVFPVDDYTAQVKVSPEDVKAYYDQNHARFAIPATVTLDVLPLTQDTLARPQDVSEVDVQAYYEKNQSKFTRQEQVRARHLLIRVPKDASEDARAQALAKIKDIRTRIEKGLDFATAAEQFSQDETTAAQGGELGFFARGAMVKPFEDAAFALTPGLVSDPVLTEFGWHLLKVEERKPAGPEPLAEVHDTIRQTIAREKAGAKLNDVQDEAVDQTLSGLALEEIAKGVGLTVGHAGPMDKEKLAQDYHLSKEAVTAIFAAEPGKPLRQSFQMPTGTLLVRVTAKTPEGLKPLDEVKDQIVLLLTRERATAMAKTAAEALAKDLQDPARQEQALAGHKVLTSKAFDRSGQVPDLGQSADLAKAVFTATGTGQWLSQPYPFSRGFFLASPAGLQPPADADWQAQKAGWIKSLTQARQMEVFNAFLAEVRAKTPVRIVNQKIFE